MQLLLDIGNTRIKWAVQEHDRHRYGAPLLHRGQGFRDIAQDAWKELEKPERVIVSNVAGKAIEKKVTAWTKRNWKVTPEYLHPQPFMCGVTNAYNKPERLGADRWAGLLAAHAYYPGTVMIVDCGTAITVDALSASGKHLGGLIVPGVDMMAAALTQNAADIVLGELESKDVSLLGSSTESAVSGGVLYAAVAFIDRIVSDLQAELDEPVKLLVSGGDAQRIRPLLSHGSRYDEHLVLKGLAVYAEEALGCVT